MLTFAVSLTIPIANTIYVSDAERKRRIANIPAVAGEDAADALAAIDGDLPLAGVSGGCFEHRILVCHVCGHVRGIYLSGKRSRGVYAIHGRKNLQSVLRILNGDARLFQRVNPLRRNLSVTGGGFSVDNPRTARTNFRMQIAGSLPAE